jgi:MYXO-CTERM domain-containing protein
MPMLQLTVTLSALLTLAGSETGTDTTDTTEDGFDEGCGSNCSSSIDPEFLSPTDGAIVESPVTVTVDPGQTCECDTCGCHYSEVIYLNIWANGELVTGAGFDDLGPFELDLAPGVYELIARSESFLGFGESDPITITVIEGQSSGTDGESESSGDEESSGGNLSGEDEATAGTGSGGETEAGCGCVAARGSSWFAGLALLGLLALRRRRE